MGAKENTPLLFTAHGLRIQLHSHDAPIRDQWRQLFAGWLADDTLGQPADIRLELSWQDDALPRPPGSPFFTDRDAGRAKPAILSVYGEATGTVWLHFHGAGLVKLALSPPQPGRPLLARGVVTPDALVNGRFEDVTYTSLAPYLRRHGYFLLHAFAAVKEERAVLLVGGSGSGKTTTGLSLLLAGWRLLSNDVVLLQARPEGVYALPTPDSVSIRPDTLALLPELAARWPLPPTSQSALTLPAYTLTNGRWADPTLVSAIYFPQIEVQERTAVAPLSRAVALARLMEESIDQWDPTLLAEHLALLQGLSRQIRPFTLHLGPDVARIPKLLN